MIKHNQQGAVNSLMLPLILASLFFVAALGFGFWAFASRQDYKNNSDAKVADAVVAAKAAEDTVKDKQYAELAKSPLKTYQGPEQYGSLVLQYPKTWSAYVSASGQSSSAPLDGYFNPDVVPSISDQNSNFALRVQVLDQSYDQVMNGFSNQDGVSVTPYALPKVPKAVGSMITGQIENNKQGSMVVLPVRDKTLEVYTEVDAYQNDFNTIILPNLSFAP